MENYQSEFIKKKNQNLYKGRGRGNKIKLYKSPFIQSDKGRIATKKKNFQLESQKENQQNHTPNKATPHQRNSTTSSAVTV